MSPANRSKIQSATLVASVAILALVFGVMLDDKVVPENKKPLMSEEAEKKDKKTADIDPEIKQTLQQQAAKRRKQESAQIEKLDQKAEVAVQKAERTIIQTDELISKAGLPEPANNKDTPTQNQKVAERLAKARERLDALKNKKTDKGPGEI